MVGLTFFVRLQRVWRLDWTERGQEMFHANKAQTKVTWLVSSCFLERKLLSTVGAS